MTSRREIICQKAQKNRRIKNRKLFSKVNVSMMLLSSVFVLENVKPTNTLPVLTKTVEAKNSPSQFLGLVAEYAKEVAAKNDLYASVMIAQAALESSWGNSTLATNYHNLFGIKGSYNGQSAQMNTLEDDGSGNYYGITDGFRVYDNYGQSLADYASVLTGDNNPDSWRYNFYKGARKSNTSSYTDATSWLTGRYATDTSYGQKLNQLIANYNLTQYDGGYAQAVETQAATPSESTQQAVGAGSYQVKAGDSVWGIAHRYGMTMEALRAANNLSGNFIYPGQVLAVSGTSTASQPSQAVNNRTDSVTVDSTEAAAGSYVVKAGDSVWGIAHRYGISMEALTSANGISNNFIYPGQVLQVNAGQVQKQIPSQAIDATNVTETSAGSLSGSSYTVKAGDSVWGIAHRFGISMDSLVSANGIVNNFIYPGQSLAINGQAVVAQTNNQAETTPAESVAETAQPVETTVADNSVATSASSQGTYVVQRGDSLYAIARKNGISLDELVTLNGFSGYDQLILPGQVVLV